jgi:signal transduction histidine kinase
MNAPLESTYESESAAINATRIPIASAVFLLAVGGTGVVEMLYRPHMVGRWIQFYAAEALVIGLPLLFRRRLMEHRRFDHAVLLSWITVVFLIHLYSLIGPTATMIAGYAVICIMTGASLLTWWSVTSQSCLVAASCLIFSGLIVLKGESGLDTTLAMFGVFAGGLISIQGNLYLDLHRRAILREALRSDDEASITRALEEFARELSRGLRDEGVEDRVVQLARRAIGGDWALLLENDGDGTLRLTGGDGRLATSLDNLKALDLHAADMPFPEAPTDRELTVVGARDNHASPVLARDWSGEILLAPLRHCDAQIGLLAAGMRDSSPRAHRLMRGIAQHAAIAIANSRLLDELRRASAMKSDFLATMSHELRTPLHVIMGYTEMLGDILDQGADPEVVQILRRLEQNERTLTDLIEGTLDAHRLEAGKNLVKVMPFDATHLFAQVQRDARWLPRTPGVQLQWQLPGNPIPMHSDPTKLTVIAKNLIGNALKFTKRGAVHVLAEHNCDDETLALTVSDSGPGIPPEEIPHIFEMFRQASPIASESSLAGVGLGLYIVREFALQLRGEVTVGASRAGGAQFRIEIPLTLGTPAPIAATNRLVA